jgi:alpha-beta hydrolase superfamily lysophospholipase
LQVILDEVAAEMNRIVTLFRKHSRRFSGKISIAAHSLGGVICFDLLANQESVRLHPIAWKRKIALHYLETKSCTQSIAAA